MTTILDPSLPWVLQMFKLRMTSHAADEAMPLAPPQITTTARAAISNTGPVTGAAAQVFTVSHQRRVQEYDEIAFHLLFASRETGSSSPSLDIILGTDIDELKFAQPALFITPQIPAVSQSGENFSSQCSIGLAHDAYGGVELLSEMMMLNELLRVT